MAGLIFLPSFISVKCRCGPVLRPFGVFALFHSVFLRYFGRCFCFTRYTVPRLVRWKMSVADMYSLSLGSWHTSKHRRKYCSAGERNWYFTPLPTPCTKSRVFFLFQPYSWMRYLYCQRECDWHTEVSHQVCWRCLNDFLTPLCIFGKGWRLFTLVCLQKV